ncbi:hypothetical protein ACMD2_25423 [Ananas comosus]|uniref:Uncharacterized protein n=1 Tax=Ananas comosus TaxID=4615 RepID=A0A199VBU0_ANACO|nr:hypothetical protein ACMD2_25423 [Ananas comosus]
MSLLISHMSGSHTLAAPRRRRLLLLPSSHALNHPSLSFSGAGGRGGLHVARARRGLSSRTQRQRLDKQGKKGAGGTPTTTTKEQDEEEEAEMVEMEIEASGFPMELSPGPMPQLPGEQPDFWEGPRWDALGFFVQYQWAFGIVFALIACGIAVSTYNEGATDFRDTPAYKESIQSRELLEEPESSNSDVFEGNPTEVAPSLE